jgi:hypothetical protein
MSLLSDAVDAVTTTVQQAGDSVGEAVEEGWDEVSASATESWENVSEGAGDIWEEVSIAAGDAWESVAGTSRDIWEEVAGGAEDVWQAVADLAEHGWENASRFIELSLDRFDAVAEEAWERLADWVEQAWETLARHVEKAWGALVGVVEAAWEALEKTARRAWELAVRLTDDAIGAAVDLYENSLDIIVVALLVFGDIADSIVELILQFTPCLASQIAFALAKAYNVIANAGKPIRKLSPSFRQEEGDLFSDFHHWENIFYIDEANLVATYFKPDVIAMTFAGVTMYGVPLNYAIFFRPSFDESRLDLRTHMVHELVHVRQLKRFVLEPAFACAYGLGYALAGFDYYSNPLEREAYDFERKTH